MIPPRLRRRLAGLGLALAVTAAAGCTTGESSNESAPGPRTSPGGVAAGVGPDGTTGLDNGSQGSATSTSAAPGQ
jgi:hypothetical protein